MPSNGRGESDDFPWPGYYRAIFEKNNAAVLVVDAARRIVDANPAAAALLNTTREHLLALSLGDLQLTVEADQYAPRQTILQTVSGAVLHVEVTAAALIDSPTGHTAIFIRDITGHVVTIESYRQLVADLDDFAHVVAHDLQNPLNNILHAVSMLGEDVANLPLQTVRKLTSVALRSTHKSLNIIDELLLLAGIRQDQDVPIEKLNMAMIIAEVQERLQYMIEDTEAVIHLPEAWPEAWGHPAWVEEVWANYISNAIKYGGIPPVLTLGAESEPGGMVRFWVKDNGRGVPPDEAERLFTAFSRLDHVRARGYGLGLSIVYRIVSRLGGQVALHNAPEGGAVFSFTLPAVR